MFNPANLSYPIRSERRPLKTVGFMFHLRHHGRDFTTRFGVSSPFRDLVFGTYPRGEARRVRSWSERGKPRTRPGVKGA